ncbi:ferrous iron transport protein B [bacterium]|nr:ferrous iron transport protein B [candidate division CSSED10-310 bacterium]
MQNNSGLETVRVAMAGNPNSGKSSIFNALTGSRQHIGNYPGVTVEKKEGMFREGERSVHVVDLPGIYSLTSYSQEEVIARQHIVESKPAVVVNVIDASNLERNLYLTLQLLEMGLNVVIALNMMDEVEKRGIELDVDMLSRRLGCYVAEVVGHKNIGIDNLKKTILKAFDRGGTETEVIYRAELGREVEKIVKELKQFKDIPYPEQFAAIKLLENDTEVVARLKRQEDSEALFNQISSSIHRLENLYGYPPEVLIGDRRYGYVSGLVKEITIRAPAIDRITLTERIDTLVTHRYLGIPLFLLTMYLIFWMTFTLGHPPMRWIEKGLSLLTQKIDSFWPSGASLMLKSLINDGIIGGVGGVIIFLPNILFLFLGISFLEDTGYMARIAFIMDKIMHKIGLHGRSFIPLLIGFGCTVPAILATRTIRSEKTRFTTIFILPLMSCGARLTIYLMVIPAFFPRSWQAPVLWSIYLIGILLALLLAKLLRKSLFRGEAEPFVMELPPYRMPSMKAIVLHMWDKSWQYIKKAGTIILAVSILIWILLTFPRVETKLQVNPPSGQQAQLSEESIRQKQLMESYAGRIGRIIEPALKPMGFDWKIGTSFIGAFAAKELFVAQMSIVYSIGDSETSPETLREVLRKNYSPLTGFCIMIFALIGTPCVATLAVTKKEMGSWKWVAIQWAGLTGMAWVVTTAIYQLGRLL